MHFMWMVHRLASLGRPTKYASAACCRVKMTCTWKHMSYHPTSRAISWTKCKKGSLQMRRSILFWNWQISWRATIPGQYLQGFFPFQELFLRSLTSNGKCGFPLGWLLPTQCRWPGLYSHLGQLSGWGQIWWPPHPSQLLCLLNPLLQLTLGWRVSTSGIWGSCQRWEFVFRMYLCPGPYLHSLPALPHSGCFLCSCHTGKESQPIRSQSSFARVMWHLFWINKHISEFHEFCCWICSLSILPSFLPRNMSEEWSKYVKILEREDKEFQRALEEEVGTLFFL